LRTDVLTVAAILAFTAVPVGLHLPDQQILGEFWSFELFPVDFAANVLGYVPLGMVLAKRGVWRTLLIAGLLSTCAETIQLFSVGRDAGVVDIATNLAGAGLGFWLAARGRELPDQFVVTRLVAAAAIAAAALYMLLGASFTAEALLHELRAWSQAGPWMTTNARGATSDGVIEAHLPFERIDRGLLHDVSKNRIDARAVNGPTLASGVVDSAITLNGEQWVDLGDPVALRLTRSMTLSAWVRPLAFPVDDAAIISSLSNIELGYQLDLTIDQGPRVIGFKVAGGSGRLMARYGKTPLVAGRWYHVAGVYNADERAMDVYLDGRLDNGCLLGDVTDHQRPSSGHVFVGRRAGDSGFEFTGSIDEAEIQSRPRGPSEIEAEVRAAGRFNDESSATRAANEDIGTAGGICANYSRAPRVAGPLVSLGMLLAVGCVGLLRGSRASMVVVALCLLTGMTAKFWAPTFESIWLPTLCVCFGGIVVLVARALRRSDHQSPERERA